MKKRINSDEMKESLLWHPLPDSKLMQRIPQFISSSACSAKHQSSSFYK
jgi:hypothetical protein